MQTEFTPLMSLLGGALIGLAAVFMMFTNGRIAGVSGIVSRLLPPWPDAASVPTGLAFVMGVMVAAPAYIAFSGGAPAMAISSNVVLMAVAGLLVGFGSVIGNGCTSGHGVCGISRLSMRSVLATLSFMGSGVATVFVVRHVLGA